METRLVKQHNAISTARYQMSSLEKNIVYTLMGSIKPGDQAGKFYEIPLRELEKSAGKNINYKHFAKSSNLLVDRVFGVDLDKKGYVDMNLFLSAKYINKKGSIRLELAKEVHALFVNLKNNFTTFQLKVALGLRSKHAKRLYEMLSQYKDTGNMYVNINVLKERLGVREQYAEFSMFRKKVLEIARKQIQEKSEFTFTYKAIKAGKKYTHLHFRIKKNTLQIRPQAPRNEEQFDQPKLMKVLVGKYQLSSWQAVKIIEQVPLDYLHKELHAIQLLILDRKISNIGGYVANRFNQKYRLNFSPSK